VKLVQAQQIAKLERQVEQQFERRGGTVCLMSIASAHTPGVVVQSVSDDRCRAHA
jgi:hypothetical protein